MEGAILRNWVDLEITYSWERVYEDLMEAKAVSNSLHNSLRGNEDYICSRIVLSWSSKLVGVYEFEDSITHIEVDESGPLPVVVLVEERSGKDI